MMSQPRQSRPRPTPPLDEQQLEQLAGYLAASLAGNGVGKKLDEIKATLLQLQEQAKNDHTLVAKHELTLFGDEEAEGMKSQVKHLQRVSSTATWALGIVAGAVLTITVSALYYLIVTHPMP